MNTYKTQDSVTGDRTVGGNNVIYDLSGTIHEFKKDFKFVYYLGANGDPVTEANDQVVEIAYPAWLVTNTDKDAIAITVKYDTKTPDSKTVQEVLPYFTQADYSGEETGWTEVEEDQTAMGKAMLLWNNPNIDFEGRLVSKFKMRIKDVKSTAVYVEYHSFMKDAVDYDNFRTSEGPQYTRELGKAILDKLADLDAKTEVVARNMFGNTAATTDVLDEDLTGILKDNFIENELHTVDTTAGKTLLAPAKGSFYPGSATNNNLFSMFNYRVEEGTVTESVANEGTYNGWLFLYSVNNMVVYVATSDTIFQDKTSYFTVDGNGDFQRLVAGTDYSVGDAITGDVYNIKRVPFDQTKSFDGMVNDTSAVITAQRSVVIDPSTSRNFLNYTGKFVDIGLKTLGQPGGSQVLTLGTDYEFANVNFAKTKKTYAEQAVYDHVRLLKDLVTDHNHRVGISYQAYGGQVLPADVRNIRQDLTNLLEVITQNRLLTVDGLSKHPIITEISKRLRRMEDYHNHFNQVDHLIPMELEGFQWFNIAQLYDARWLNGPNALRDIGTFRVSSKEQGWTYEFVVTTDLTQKGSNRLSVKVVGATGHEVDSVNNFVAIAEKEVVGVRVVWNEGNGTTTTTASSGAILQIGFDCSRYFASGRASFGDIRDYDTMTVTNKSGDTSSWQLIYNPVETTREEGNFVNVYGRCKYKLVTSGTVDPSVTYYQMQDDFLYFKTSSTTALSGVQYYYVDADTGVFRTLTCNVGTVFADLDVGDVYERGLRGKVWTVTSAVAGTAITAASNLWIVDELASTDTNGTTLPDTVDVWGPGLANSNQAACLLDRDGSGVIVWAGSIPLSNHGHYAPTDTGEVPAVESFELNMTMAGVVRQYLDPMSVTATSVVIYDRKTGHFITKKYDLHHDDSNARTQVEGEGFFFFEDLCALWLQLSRPAPRKMTLDDVFLSTKKYFTYDATTGEFSLLDASGRIGSTAERFIVTTDTAPASGKRYYEYNNLTGGYDRITPTNPFFLTLETTAEPVADRTYYTKSGSTYTSVGTLESFESGVEYYYVGTGTYYESVLEDIYVEDDSAIMTIEAGLGTSSIINERFDLRLVRLHF